MSLFSPITYHISPSLPPTLVTQLDLILQANGGTRASGTKDPNLTTVISDSLRFDGWEDVAARRSAGTADEITSEEKKSVHVVTPNFVERSIVISKLQLPQHYSVDPSMFFSGVIACGSDLPPNDLEVLSGGITGLGGQWRSALTKECTHLFAISPDSHKYSTAMHFQPETKIKIVLPHWFDDCVRLGIRGLSEEMYEWPECRILKGPDGLLPTPKDKRKEDDKVVDKEIESERERMKRNLYITAAKFTPSMNRSSPPSDADLTLVAPSTRRGASPNTSNLSAFLPINASGEGGAPEPHEVWEGRKILLSRTLQLYGHRREAVQAGVERAGGLVLRYEGDDEEQEGDGNSQGQGPGWNEQLSRKEKRRRRREAGRVAECDVLVTRWRHGRGYIQAVRTQKMVGTLAWLFHVQSCGIITHPINQLLHYPVPKRPIEAFQNHVITVTNYTGEAREYLKKLVSAMGAEFTPSMSGQNTVLVAAYTSGTKATKALSWSIPVVNHLWLEDCFISWRNLTVANAKYIIFRPGEDFSRRLGERGLAVGVANGISGAFGGVVLPGANGEALSGDGEGGDRELGRIEQEAEELAEDEDDLGNSDDDAAEEREEERERERLREIANAREKELQLQLPNGTEASMKEVMDDLVQDQGGVDFDMDVDVDFAMEVLDEARVSTSTPKKGKGAPTTMATKGKTNSPVKPSFNPSPSSAKPEDKTKQQKQKKKTSASSDEDEGEGRQVIELDETSEEEQEEQEQPKKTKATKSTKKVSSTLVAVVLPAKTATSKSKSKAKPAAKSSSEDEDENEESVKSPSPAPKKVKTPAKSKRQELPLSSEEEVDDEEEEEIAKPIKQNTKAKEQEKTKTKKQLARRPVSPARLPVEEEESTPQPLTPLPKTKAKMKPPARRGAVEVEADGDDDDEEEVPAKSKTKAPVAAASGSAAAGGGGGLLTRVKGDARTRIKKKKEKEKPVVESEDDDDDEVEIKKGKGKSKEKEKEVRGRKKGKKVDEDDEDEVEVLVTSSKANSKMKTKSKKKAAVSSEDEDEVDPPPKKRTKKPSPPPTKARSKPLRVYSTEEEDEEEDDEEIPDAAADDSDEDLPENPIISSKSQRPGRGKEKENKASSKLKSKEPKSAVGKVKAKKAPTPSDTETDEEEVEEPPPRKTNGKTSNPSPIKRIVSVLMPSLGLSPSKATNGKEKFGGKTKGKKPELSSSEEEEDPKPVAKPKKTASKAQLNPKPKGKPKAASPVVSENESDEEEEVNVLVSPRTTRALARTESIRAVAGQAPIATSSPSKAAASASISAAIRAKKASKNDTHTNATASNSKAISAAIKSKSRPRDDSMDVDNISTSTVAVSAPLPRRSAAAKATQRLHETIMPDLVQFEAQMKKAKRGSSHASAAFALEGEEDVSQTSEKRKQAGGDYERKAAKKRRVSNVVLEDDADAAPVKSAVLTKDKGKSRTKAGTAVDDAMDVDGDKSSPGSGIIVMTTQVTLSEDVIKALGKLGVKMSSRPTECTHLLAPHIVRTEKFLCALTSRAPWILQEKWAIESARTKRVLPEKDFVLKDKTGENKYGFNLANSLKRAKELKETGGLLSGHTFYLTPKVPVDAKLLKNVVVACGGVISTQTPTLRIINAASSTRHVISCKEDIAIWRPLTSSRSVKIYTQELILTGILKQEMEWDEEEYLVRGSY